MEENKKAAPEETRKPGYFAVIPADVRYDRRLTPNEKLLYGELTALASREGYCWPSNKWLASLFSSGGKPVTEKTVSVWIGQLKKCGHICTQTLTQNGMVIGRRIYIRSALPDLPEKVEIGIPKNRETYPEKSGDVSRKIGNTYPEKSGVNNTRESNKTSNPMAPVGYEKLAALIAEKTGRPVPNEVGEALSGFCEMRSKIRKPVNTARTVEIIARKLLEFSGGDPATMVQVLDYSTERSYQGIFDPKARKAPMLPMKQVPAAAPDGYEIYTTSEGVQAYRRIQR